MQARVSRLSSMLQLWSIAQYGRQLYRFHISALLCLRQLFGKRCFTAPDILSMQSLGSVLCVLIRLFLTLFRLVHKHNILRDTLFNLACLAHLAPRKEETYLFDDSAERPADILLPSWSGGHDLCVDVSVVSPFVSVGPNQINGAVEQTAEHRKMAKCERSCEERNILFTPFILETTGGFGTKTPLLRCLAVALADVERSEVFIVLQRIRQ